MATALFGKLIHPRRQPDQLPKINIQSQRDYIGPPTNSLSRHLEFFTHHRVFHLSHFYKAQCRQQACLYSQIVIQISNPVFQEKQVGVNGKLAGVSSFLVDLHQVNDAHCAIRQAYYVVQPIRVFWGDQEPRKQIFKFVSKLFDTTYSQIIIIHPYRSAPLLRCVPPPGIICLFMEQC